MSDESFRGWLIAGLGNPDRRYETTRHNIGFGVVDELARRWGVADWSRRFHGLFATARPADLAGAVLMLKPMTYMNRSALAVQGAMTFYRVRPDDLLVIHDDMDLEWGAIRVKVGGGTAGHRGLESIVSAIGPDFVRLRFGIGRPVDAGAVDWVLSDFSAAEAADLDRLIRLAADIVTAVLARGPAAAMNEYHRRRDPAPPPRGDGAP